MCKNREEKIEKIRILLGRPFYCIVLLRPVEDFTSMQNVLFSQSIGEHILIDLLAEFFVEPAGNFLW